MNMKKSLVILLCFLSSGILVAQDMKLDDLLAKYLKVIGQEKASKIQTIKTTGKLIQYGQVFQSIIFEKSPNKIHTEMEIQGTRIIMAFDGQNGWMINPVESLDPQDISADKITSTKKQMGIQHDPFGNFNNPFVNWKENGNMIELVGREDMNGTPVYNLKMTFNSGDVVNYYMDLEKFVILKMKQKSIINGQMREVESLVSDFRYVDGVMNPYKLETLYNGQIAFIFTRDKIEFNLPVDDAYFKKPEAEKK
jgi:hypothetical protein